MVSEFAYRDCKVVTPNCEGKKISIITVCYNSAVTIRDTIESVLTQDYLNIEYIIVDGASKDGTMDIVRQYGDKIDRVISEPDNGIYDAMNKGIGVATGDIIGLLNADDFYADGTVLESVSQCFLKDNVDIVYGDLCYVRKDKPTEIVRYWKSSEYKPDKFKHGWVPPHPTFFVRRNVYQKNDGLYDTGFKLASDFELMLRCLFAKKMNSRYLPKVLVKMRLGGKTNQSLTNIFSQNLEIFRAFKKNKLEISVFTFVFGKIVSRVKQFLVRPRL